MRKIISVLIAIFILAAFAAAFSSCSDDRQVVNVFNWGEYISDASGDINVLKEFEAETGIKVNYTTYATNEELYSKLKSSGANYDVIIPSDYMIGRLIQEGMLEKIDFANVPNHAYIMDEYKNLEFDPANEYSAPYTWGTVVLIYNEKHVTEPDGGWSWDILWDEQYSGRIIMFNNSRDAFGLTLRKLGYSLNTTNIGELERARDEMLAQKDLLQGYFMDEIFNKMGSGEAWVAPYYAGDALTMMDDNPDLAAAYPKEGTNRFVDAMCIPKGARNKENAEKFIDFMLRPDIAAANCEYIGYSTPNSGAYELLGDEITGDEITYPDYDILANTEIFLNLPEDTNKKIDELWTEIRGSTSGNMFVFPVIIALLVVTCLIIILRKKNKKKTEY